MSSRRAEASFEELPNEILFKIFSFLDARFVIEVVGKVCTQFALVLSDSAFWKTKHALDWPKPLPLPPADEFDWKCACVERERHFKLWTNWENEMEPIRITAPHIGIMNSILLVNHGSACVTASRDRDLKMWDIRDWESSPHGGCPEENRLMKSAVNAHGGWIWCLHSMGNSLVSGSFDKTVKFWDIEHGLREVKSLTFGWPVTSVESSCGELLIGLYDGTLFRYDPRAPDDPSRLGRAGGSVTCLAVSDTTVLAGASRMRLFALDVRSRKRRRDLELVFEESYPTSLSFDSRQLWIGMQSSAIATVDMTTSPSKLVQTVKVRPDEQHKRTVLGLVTTIRHTLGSVLVSFQGGPMAILEPTLDPDVSAWGPKDQSVLRFDFDGTTLATVGTSHIEVWQPKSKP